MYLLVGTFINTYTHKEARTITNEALPMTFVSHCIAMPGKAHTTHSHSLSGYRPSLGPKQKVLITLGAHAQRGYGSWVCACVCYSTSRFQCSFVSQTIKPN